MLKIYTAFTREIDNPEKAAQEILTQLNPAKNALAETIGIIHFYHEFVDTEACRAVIDALPFEAVGCVSTYVGSCEKYDEVALSVTMITGGDDFGFSIKTITGASGKSREQLAEEVRTALGELSAERLPRVVIPYIPAMPNFSGDDLVDTANSMPVPPALFGTIAFNMDTMSSSHYVLGKGEFSTELMVFVGFYGDFEPRYHITSSFDFETGIGAVAEITEAEGTILKSVDGIPSAEYLQKIGMMNSDNAVEGSVWAIPAILTYPDGTRIVRSFIGVVEGTEYIFATGAMDAGAKITFTYLDGEKTLGSAGNLLREIDAAGEDGVMFYSCAARAWSLGSNYFAEAQKIVDFAQKYRQDNGRGLNYSVAYSGGEICPVKIVDGKVVNALHNYTLISCAFC
jgi:hypothetical protein